MLEEYLWEKQADILRAVRDHRRVVVRSGHGVGKSRAVSRVVAWWGSTHPPAQTRIVTTATTFAQVRNVLWQEIASAARTGKIPGRVLQTEWHILDLDDADDELKGEVRRLNDEVGREVIVGQGRKPADHDQTAFQGIHQRYVLVVIDEADGVPAELFKQALAIATGPDCRIVAIGNPVDPGSHMAQICAPNSGWHQMWISVLHSPRFTADVVASDPLLSELFALEGIEPSTEQVPEELLYVLSGPEYVRDMAKDYGIDSPSFESRVLGRYPEDASDGIVPASAVAMARKSRPDKPGDLMPVELGVDVGAGSDLAVVRARAGLRALPTRWALQTRDPRRVVDLVMDAIEETHATAVKVDGIGWGWGIAEAVAQRCRLRELRGLPPVTVRIVLVSESSVEPRRFWNLRAELWWTAREMCADGVWDLSYLRDDDPVLAELKAPKYTTRGDRVIVEPKDETRKRLKRSPDDADALNLAYHTPRPGPKTPQVQVGDRWSAIRHRR